MSVSRAQPEPQRTHDRARQSHTPLSAIRSAAAAWGFVNKLTEPGEALAGALELAERITANGPLAVAVTKEIIIKLAGWSEDEMWKKQGELITPVFTSKDASEGATAFAEKRAPNWTGS